MAPASIKDALKMLDVHDVKELQKGNNLFFITYLFYLEFLCINLETIIFFYNILINYHVND